MGLGNDTVLSGHVGLDLHWSDGRGYRSRHVGPGRPLNTVPIPGGGVHWVDDLFKRPAVKVGQAAKTQFNSAQYVDPSLNHTGLFDFSTFIPQMNATANDLKSQGNFKKSLPLVSKGLNNFDTVSKLLSQAGITGDLNTWASGQALLETNNLQSPPAKLFNYSNIAYTKNSQYQSGKGYKNWAAYKNGLQWAKDYNRVIHLSKTPVYQAKSLADFVSRLYSSGYVGSNDGSLPQGIYLESLKKILQARSGAAQTAKDYTAATGKKVNLQNGTIDDGKGLLAYFKAHPLITGVVAAVGGILVIKAINR